MSLPPRVLLSTAALDAENFAPFGQVIECAGHEGLDINGGSSRRFHDLARLEADRQGRLALSIFQTRAMPLPLPLLKLERHPLGSQAFVPLQGQPFLIAVAARTPDPAHPDPGLLRVFLSNGRQGINFRRGVWHHPLIAVAGGDFLVADRLGPGNNCEEIDIAPWRVGVLP
jgi:ureidoglycolate lyase